MIRWAKRWKQPPPIQNTCDHPRPNTLYSAPLSTPLQRGQGTREAFLINRQSATFQETGWDNDSLLGLWTTWQRKAGSPDKEHSFLSLSFSYLNSHMSKFSHP